jgi:hypothetical protein
MKRLLLVLLLSSFAQAAVTFDAVGPSANGATINGTNTTLTWTHVTSGSNTAMVVSCTLSATSDTGYALAATYNGVAMTARSAVHSGAGTAGFVQQFTLIAPASGSHSVSVVESGGSTVTDLICGSVTLNGVDQTTGFRNFNSATGSGTSPSVTITSASGNMVVDAIANGTAIPVSTQTVRWSWHQTNSTRAGNGGESTAAGSASVVMGYTTTSDSWAMTGIDVIALGTPSGRRPIVIQ